MDDTYQLVPVDNDPFAPDGRLPDPVVANDTLTPQMKASIAQGLREGTFQTITPRPGPTDSAPWLDHAVDASIQGFIRPGIQLGEAMHRVYEGQPVSAMDFIGPAAAVGLGALPGPRIANAFTRGTEAVAPEVRGFGLLGARPLQLSTQNSTTVAPFEGLGGAMPDAAEVAALTARVNEIHGLLGHEIAMDNRTTGIMRTYEGHYIVAGGARDLDPVQRAALRPGEIPAKLPGDDAEKTLLQYAWDKGLTPRLIVTSRDICPDCAEAIRAFGGRSTGRIAVFPPHRPPDSAGIAAGLGPDLFGAQGRLFPDHWERPP
jgi:hypothetical protein